MINTPVNALRNQDPLEGINWNTQPDPIDSDIWDRLTTNFWLPEKIPVSNDVTSWRNMTAAEQDATLKVFTGLTVLDTLQGTVGAVSLIPHAVTPQEEAVYTNIAFMEAFAAGTELLTQDGWKAIEHVTTDDLVAQYDPDTNTTSFARPKIVDPHHSEEVYEIVANNGNARQIVSGGHRVYFEEKVKKNNECQEWQPAVAEARDLHKINLKTAHRRFRSAAPAAPGDGLTDLDRMLIAINADGSIRGEQYTGEITGTIPTSFTFAKERKAERFLNLASSLGWKVSEVSSRDSRRHFNLAVPVEYVADRSKLFKHWWNLTEKSSTWCHEFIEENGRWDGHSLKGGYGVTFYTTRKEDSDFFVAAAQLAGHRSRTTVRVDDRSDTFADSYITNVTWSKDTVGAQSMQVRKVEPQMVYCVQVPTTFLVTRNGESPVISGNCVHAKSYSNIFMTLASTPEIDEAFRWSRENEHMQYKARRILTEYATGDSERMMIASVMLESFLFYSGFYLPLRMASLGKITNAADIIRLIIRDEAIHGYYIGYKYQQKHDKQRHAELQEEIVELLLDLYENESHFTEQVYDQIGWTEDVKAFLRYNANKAMNNLGYDGIFPSEECKFNAGVMTALDPSANENFDFFSGSGSSYIIGTVEQTEDDDWSW